MRTSVRAGCNRQTGWSKKTVMLGLFIVFTAVGGEARAELAPGNTAPTPALSWVRLPGAEQCIGISDLGRAVEEQLGGAIFASPTVAPFSIEGWVAPMSDDETRFRATVVMRQSDGGFVGERVLETEPGAECNSMVPALVLAIVITIDPDAALAAAEPPPPPPPPPPPLGGEPEVEGGIIEELAAIEVPLAPLVVSEPEPEPEPPAEPTTDELSSEVEELRVDLHAGFTVGLEILPGVPLGAAVSVLLDFPRFPPIEVTVGSFIGATAEHDEAEARFDQVLGRVTICVPWRLDVVQLHGCAGLEGGVTFIRGRGVDLPEREIRPVLDAVAGFNVVFRPVSRLLLRLGVTAVIPVFHDHFVYSDEMNRAQPLFEVGAFGGVFDIGVGVEL